ncbi:MAG: hypothetical protein JKY34_11515 [Kordiimonadaceae bacterium]|nr:hypothetical protein [Kordiimonadaceae bacterium]
MTMQTLNTGKRRLGFPAQSSIAQPIILRHLPWHLPRHLPLPRLFLLWKRIVAGLCIAMAGYSTANAGPADFSKPQTVKIQGYNGHAMEPFISRDGSLLFFNNRNQSTDQTDIYLAKRVTDLQFIFVGPLQGANSQALDGVPSMDRQGNFYFVSTRQYNKTANTLWQGQLRPPGRIINLKPLAGNVSRNKALSLNIDAEVSADGKSLYFTQNLWDRSVGGIKTSNILLARKNRSGRFFRAVNAKALFKNINSNLLEFAPAITTDELTLYFTRVNKKSLQKGLENGFGLYVATRPNRKSAFGKPKRIKAAKGYVEGATVIGNGCAIYFHKRVKNTFKIQYARKLDCRRK